MPKETRTKRYWFKRKRYGWGWMPSTWQGWLAVTVFLAILLITSSRFSTESVGEPLWQYLLLLVGSTTALLALSYFTGPKPKWRWGKKSTDNPREDA